MEENMKATIMMIRNKAMEFLFGQMVVDMKAIGIMVNSMDREPTIPAREKLSKENGQKERESNGLTRILHPKNDTSSHLQLKNILAFTFLNCNKIKL